MGPGAPDLPPGYQIINNGTNIVDASGKPLYLLNLDTKQWVKIDQGVKWTVVENIEDGADNPLNDQDMAPGGKVDQYLEQIKPKLMAETNWEIIKDDIPFKVYGGMIIYIPKSNAESVKFVNPEKDPSVPDTNPFDRDIDAFGLYTAGNGRKYTFIPLVIRDINAPTESGHDIYFMKLLLPHQLDDGTPLSQFEIDYMFENWNNRMNIAPIGYGNSTHGWLWDVNENPDGDPMFDYLKPGSPEFELWTSVFIALGKQEPVHGPLSELKTLNGKVFLTEAANLTNEDRSEFNVLKIVM